MGSIHSVKCHVTEAQMLTRYVRQGLRQQETPREEAFLSEDKQGPDISLHN